MTHNLLESETIAIKEKFYQKNDKLVFSDFIIDNVIGEFLN